MEVLKINTLIGISSLASTRPESLSILCVCLCVCVCECVCVCVWCNLIGDWKCQKSRRILLGSSFEMLREDSCAGGSVLTPGNRTRGKSNTTVC